MQSEILQGHECETAAPAIRDLYGCNSSRDQEACLEFDGLVIDRCPAYYLKNGFDIGFAIQVYNWREKGFLPYAGNWMEQPHKIVEICGFMDRLLSYKMKNELETRTPDHGGD